MAQKILVTGGNGQLGSEIRELSALSGDAFTFVDIDTIDLTEKQGAMEYLEAHAPDWIINCAAYTAVDRAEEEPGVAEQVNAGIPAILAEYGASSGCRIIHISTDYVFAGDLTRPIRETDTPAPLSAYGKSKYNGEKAVMACKNAMVIRTSWLYSAYGNNFVKSMMRLMQERDTLRIVYDQVGTPTYGADLAGAILEITGAGPGAFVPGIFHYSNEGVASWYDFAFEIREITGADCLVEPIETKDYPLPARRPAFAVLNKEKIREQYALRIPHWKSGLQRCIEKLNKKN
jgi:dTDP-4-dehydrorhamnose reductase